MVELGPASKALLEEVNMTFGFVQNANIAMAMNQRLRLRRTENWWFRRLVALALEGLIEGTVYRDGDEVAIRFRRRPEVKQ